MGPPSARPVAALAAALLLTGAAPAAALDWAVGADGGWFDMTNASNTAKAIFGGSAGGSTGGGLVEIGLTRAFFVGAHVRYFQRQGERVFVAAPGSPVFRLGHPLKVRLVPSYAVVGYRFGQSTRWAPWVSLGVGATSYREESNVAGLIESTSSTKAAGHGALGVDFYAGVLRFGLEATYSTVPNTIGTAGVSKVYGEKDVGGVTFAARVMFGSAR